MKKLGRINKLLSQEDIDQNCSTPYRFSQTYINALDKSIKCFKYSPKHQSHNTYSSKTLFKFPL